MGRYLDILRQAEAQRCDISDISDKRAAEAVGEVPKYSFGRFGRFSRTFAALEARCPDRVPIEHWQQAVEDGRAFLARWGERAHALGWTAKDLFGLLPMAKHTKPSFNRLARYDEIGLIWLLRGRGVAALTDATAAIRNPTGSITIYRRHNKSALGPLREFSG